MNGFNQYIPNLLIWLTYLVLNENNHVFMDTGYIGVTFFQKPSSKTGKNQYSHTVRWCCMHWFEIWIVVIEPDENTINKLNHILTKKWDLMSPSAHFRGDLIRWRSLHMRQLWFTTATIHFESAWWRYMCNMLDAAFSLNTQEVLKILCVIPVGSVEAETFFSFIRWIHNGLRNFIRGLGRYCCTWSCSYLFLNNICNLRIHLHRLMFHFFLTLDLIDICTFCRLSSLWYRYLTFCKSHNYKPEMSRFHFHCFVRIVKSYAF